MKNKIDPNYTLPPLSYASESEADFHQALMAAANDYLKQKNDHRYADARLLLKNGLMLAACILFYLFSLRQSNTWLFAGGYFGFMLMAMLLNINAQHDACHHVFFRSRWANRLLGRIVTLPLGIEPDYWRTRHVVYHHIYPNIERYDLDMEENGFLRQTPFQRWFPHMRYQQFYWPLIAALSLPYIAWVFDWSDRLNKTALAEQKLLAGGSGWLLFLGSKVLHFTLVLLIPIGIVTQQGIGWPTVLITYLGTQMLASFIVVVLLLGTHWANAHFYRAPNAGKMPHGWYQHNFATACDWNPTPQRLDELFGGLNLHLTHHLFPGWSHRHYPALANIVAKLAAEYQLPYRCIGYQQLFKEQQQFLRQMGQKPTPPINKGGE